MSSFYKYHIGSGNIETKIVVSDISNLAIHKQDGYDFIEVVQDYILGKCYITQERDYANREVISGGGNITTVIGEMITIDLPDVECWVRFGSNSPSKITDGELSIAKNSAGTVSMELVGKYSSSPWILKWKTLEEYKEEAKLKIDTDAELERSNHNTSGTGQAITYLRKADAARALLRGETLPDVQLKRIQDEADRLNVSLEEAASTIVQSADAWESRDVEIDRLRLVAKTEINSAETGGQINKILNSVKWKVDTE